LPRDRSAIRGRPVTVRILKRRAIFATVELSLPGKVFSIDVCMTHLSFPSAPILCELEILHDPPVDGPAFPDDGIVVVEHPGRSPAGLPFAVHGRHLALTASPDTQSRTWLARDLRPPTIRFWLARSEMS
jgi:hypothetical protein